MHAIDIKKQKGRWRQLNQSGESGQKRKKKEIVVKLPNEAKVFADKKRK